MKIPFCWLSTAKPILVAENLHLLANVIISKNDLRTVIHFDL